MAASTSIPSCLTQGDSADFLVAVTGYSAASYTGNFALNGPSQLSLTGSNSSGSFEFVLTPAQSETLRPGTYSWSVIITQSTTFKKTALTGTLIVNADLAATPVVSHAANMLNLIEAVLEDRIPDGIEESSIDLQMVRMMSLKDLMAARSQYRREVAAENAALARAQGRGNNRTIKSRFTLPMTGPSGPYPF